MSTPDDSVPNDRDVRAFGSGPHDKAGGSPSFRAPPGASYLEGPPRQVPGFAGLHRMAAILLGERVAPDGRVLVLGAGGGLELRALAEAAPGWSFDGVDPSTEMLALAAETVKPHGARVRLHEGTIDGAPEGPFDGAVSLLTFHFIAADRRLETLRQIRRRLKTGAPLVLAHLSFPQAEPARSQWIARHLAFGATPATDIEAAAHAIRTRLSVLAPDEEEAMLRDAGYAETTLFYAGFGFRGWVAYAG